MFVCRFAPQDEIMVMASRVKEITCASLSACLEAVTKAKKREVPLPGLGERSSIVNEAVQYIMERSQAWRGP